jgi:hypothetical protein
LEKAAYSWWKSFFAKEIHDQGVSGDAVVLSWKDVLSDFMNTFAYKESYGVLEQKSRNLKWTPNTSIFQFYFDMVQVIDRMHITDDQRRISYILRGLPVQLAREIYMNHPHDTNDVWEHIKTLDRFDKIVERFEAVVAKLEALRPISPGPGSREKGRATPPPPNAKLGTSQGYRLRDRTPPRSSSPGLEKKLPNNPPTQHNRNSRNYTS